MGDRVVEGDGWRVLVERDCYSTSLCALLIPFGCTVLTLLLIVYELLLIPIAMKTNLGP
jgi:hypothetical protein